MGQWDGVICLLFSVTYIHNISILKFGFFFEAVCQQNHFLRYVVFTTSSTVDMYKLLELCNQHKHKQVGYQSKQTCQSYTGTAAITGIHVLLGIGEHVLEGDRGHWVGQSVLALASLAGVAWRGVTGERMPHQLFPSFI